MTHTIGIYLFDDVEVLDFAGPFEVFFTASRLHSRLHPADPALFEVFTVAKSADPITTRGGLQVKPHYDFSNHPPINTLIVPGGVIEAELQQPAVIEWIKATSRSTRYTASVCTGAFLLAEAGLLHQRQAVTHWEDLHDLQSRYPHIQVLSDHRWVESGHIITAAGISAGIDMSLYLVARLAEADLALRTARQMEYTSHHGWGSA